MFEVTLAAGGFLFLFLSGNELFGLFLFAVALVVSVVGVVLLYTPEANVYFASHGRTKPCGVEPSDQP